MSSIIDEKVRAGKIIADQNQKYCGKLGGVAIQQVTRSKYLVRVVIYAATNAPLFKQLYSPIRTSLENRKYKQ